MLLPSLLSAALLFQDLPLPEGNAFVLGLTQKQRHSEERLNEYAYDVLEVREDLDKKGAVTKRQSRGYETFYVRRVPVRRLVSEDGRPLAGDRQAKVDQQVRRVVESIHRGQVGEARARARLSLMVEQERYDFRSVARELVDGRPAIVLDFSARPGKRDLPNDRTLRALAGRIWVDEADRELVRAEIRSTSGIKFALGIGASVSQLDFAQEFRKVDGAVWLPKSVSWHAAGRMFLVKGFRTRSTTTFANFKRFAVETEERLEPSPPPF